MPENTCDGGYICNVSSCLKNEKIIGAVDAKMSLELDRIIDLLVQHEIHL